MLCLSCGTLPSCGDSEKAASSTLAVEPSASDATRMDVTLEFSPKVGAEPFACDRTYTGIFKNGTTIAPLDFRVYVHDVVLVRPGGTKVPLSLVQDGRWQFQNVALLDFENKEGTCGNGTPETNDALVGTAPPGRYVGVEFSIGVPRALNHQNMLMAAPPLTYSGLWWVWKDGYKFLRADVKLLAPDGQSSEFIMHLGSAACASVPPYGASDVVCDRPNRGRVVLPLHDPRTQVIVADYASLVRESDPHSPDEEGGCMSEMDTAGCKTLFERLGVDPATGAPDPSRQALFRVDP